MPLNKGYLTAKTDIKSDEYFTPDNAVKKIINFIPKDYKTIWCPFDTAESPYVKILKEKGYEVFYSHINDDKNFFFYEPEEKYDCIISNPPFSLKDDVLKRLHELNKPYAILLPLPSLQGQKRFDYIKDCEVLVFDKRVNFFQDIERTISTKGVSFASIYVCKDFLPEKLIFEKLDN